MTFIVIFKTGKKTTSMKNYIQGHKNALLDERIKRKQDFIVNGPKHKVDPGSL